MDMDDVFFKLEQTKWSIGSPIFGSDELFPGEID